MSFDPTQARGLFLSDQLQRKCYTRYLDDLFISTKICRTTYVVLKSKVTMHGVTRSFGYILPEFMTQKKVTGLQDKQALTITTKADVLTGDDECSALLAILVCDSKPAPLSLNRSYSNKMDHGG